VVALDVPLLIEAGSVYPWNALVVVSAPLRSVARRLRIRSGWALSEVKRRQAFQVPLRKKERMADFVVKNSGSMVSTRRQVVRIWNQIT
jgi:dephospho-CoA kinase